MIHATIVTARAFPDYIVELEFSDGLRGHVSFKSDVQQGVFKRISDPSKFANLRIGQRGTVLYWEVDAPQLETPDACADWLHQQIEKNT